MALRIKLGEPTHDNYLLLEISTLCDYAHFIQSNGNVHSFSVDQIKGMQTALNEAFPPSASETAFADAFDKLQTELDPLIVTFLRITRAINAANDSNPERETTIDDDYLEDLQQSAVDLAHYIAKEFRPEAHALATGSIRALPKE